MRKEVRFLHGWSAAVCCLLFQSALSLCRAQTEISQFRPGVTVEGVNYFLPRTLFKVVLVSEKAVSLPGEFAAYSDRYLRQPDVPKEESTLWTLKNIMLIPYGVPDSSKAYSIVLKAKTSAPLVSLTSDGLLLGINTQVEAEPEVALPQPVAAPKAVNGRDYMTHEILSAGSTAKMAQLTAEEIYDLRDSRNSLIRGDADNTPKDGAQLKLMLDNLDRQINGLESLFKGQTLVSTEVQTLTHEPSGHIAPGGESVMLCRYSRRLGLVDADDLSGEPVWLTITPMGTLPERIYSEDTDKKRSKMEQGVYVNQPERAKVAIALGSRQLLEAEADIAQLGTTEVLSDALFNKKLETRVTLHQHTGSVKKIE